MIDDIIKKIVETENESDLLIKKAFEEAKELVHSAEEKKKSIIEDTKRYFKEEKAKAVALAEEAGAKRYREIVEKGRKAGEELKQKTKTEELAVYIAETFKEKYGSN